MSGGVYDYDNLYDGVNAVCIGLQHAIYQAPFWLGKIYRNVTRAFNLIAAQGEYFADLGCPEVQGMGDQVVDFEEYSGWERSWNFAEWLGGRPGS